MSEIHVFKHHAMATHFEVRIAGEDKTYAEQAAQAAFAVTDELESKLSRFRVNSEIAHLAHLGAGESMRVSAPVFACLQLAKKMETATHGAFSILATATVKERQSSPPSPSPCGVKEDEKPGLLTRLLSSFGGGEGEKSKPQVDFITARWSLDNFSVRCESGKLAFDLGAIGKGFALDRMAEVLREWSCPAFLLVAGGSSILAGDAPQNSAGWSCGLGDDGSPQRFNLKNISLSGSGLAVKGAHIFDPRTGDIAKRKNRAWALTDSAAESDALSTACMVLDETEILEILAAEKAWLVFLEENKNARPLGSRALPERA